jgi:hypothetical protein
MAPLLPVCPREFGTSRRQLAGQYNMLPLWGRDPGSFFNSRDHRPFPRPVPLNEVLLCYTLSCMSWVTVKLVWAIVPKERPPMTQSGGT